MNIYDLISRAQKLRKETQLDSVSPDRVGGLHEDTLKYINEFQLLASSPSLHKIYASVSAMQSDKSPKSDLTGKPLKPGQLVVIVPANQTDATAGDVYRYDGPSGNTSAWTFIAKIGAVPADAELSATSTNPPQNKVVTEKLTELESRRLYTLLGLANGYINTKGSFFGAENRLCTNYISGVFTIVTANGFRIRSVAKYDKESLSFVELSTIYDTYYTNNGDYVVRVVIDNYNDTPISLTDNVFSSMQGGDFVDSFGIRQTKILAEKNEAFLQDLSHKVDLNSIILEQGGIQAANGLLIDSDVRVRTKNFIKGNLAIEVPSGIQIAYIFYYHEDTLLYDSYENVFASQGSFGKDGYVYKLAFCKSDRNLPLDFSEIKQISDLDKLSASVAEIKSMVGSDFAPAMVKFDFNHDMLNVTSRLNVMGVSSSRGAIEKVYKAFDRLAALYPNYVSKFDPMAVSDTTETIDIDGKAYTINVYAMADIKAAMAEKGISDYPIYCKGISEPITKTLHISDGSTYDVTYEITPAYKTYVYRFKNESLANTDLNKKKSAFLIGGLHGNELAAPMNLAIFASLLCDGYLTETNYYKLRAAFDFYIVPYINGYGSYHGTRANANQVDLNRNFPCSVWNLSDKDTIGDANLSTFSGGSAGSEFETKLIMSLTEYVNPDFTLDHHNYGNGGNQLYSEIPRFPQIAQQASVDMAIAFAKNFPQYYGDKYLDTLFGSESGAPGFNKFLLLSHSVTWWYEQGIKFPAIIEIGNSIDWVDGEKIGNDSNWLSADTFSVGEYTLRIQLLRYMQFLLDNYNVL